MSTPSLLKVVGVCPCRYFTFPYQDMTLEQELLLLDQPDKTCHFLAHNGWVMGDDPLRNFAEPGEAVEPVAGTRDRGADVTHAVAHRLQRVHASRAHLLGRQREAALWQRARRLPLPVGPHAEIHPDHRPVLQRRPTGQLSLHALTRG